MQCTSCGKTTKESETCLDCYMDIHVARKYRVAAVPRGRIEICIHDNGAVRCNVPLDAGDNIMKLVVRAYYEDMQRSTVIIIDVPNE